MSTLAKREALGLASKLGLILALLAATPTFGQGEPAAPPPATPEAPEAGAGAATEPSPDAAEEPSAEQDFQTIDDLLLQDEEVRSDPNTYSYDPGNRRDPFRSLLVTPPGQRDTVRPPGIPGLLIDEIEIQGVFILEDGPVVQVISSDKETSFLLRPGDQLWDGEVVSITLDEIVFKQRIEDPTALKPFREVVKKL